MKKLLILSAVVTALASYGAMAAEANINFEGTVSSSTCTLNAADAAKTLSIPNVTAAELLSAGDQGRLTYAASGRFDFTNCPQGLTKVTSSYTYQGQLGIYHDWGVAEGVDNVSFSVMQSANSDSSKILYVDGTSTDRNVATITNGVATVPVTVGVSAYNASNELKLPTAGNYNGTFLVAFTYS